MMLTILLCRWIERNVYVNNTVGNKASPRNDGKDALGSDQPGLADMTVKALDTLKKRGGKNGFFLMSEAASVDKKVMNTSRRVGGGMNGFTDSFYSSILLIGLEVLLISLNSM
jgi:hypothetical protein